MAIRAMPSSSSRRLRPLLLAFVLLCTFYWLATTNSPPSTLQSTRKEAGQESSESGNPGSNNRVNTGSKLGNGKSRHLNAAVQAPVAAAPAPTNVKSSVAGEKEKEKKDLVVASMRGDNTSWLTDSLPDWHKSIYVVDDQTAELTVPVNKGRESMVYLTYIIDNYDRLPDYMLFIHSQRYQWHNDDPYYDGVPMIRRFQTPYLEKIGYTNLRCAWILGCPEEIHPMTDSDLEAVHAGPYYMNGFKELFPGVTVPDAVGVSCCAQFGVTRWKIHERPKSDYERYKRWLTETDLDDDTSGRIMEYSWHMIFGMDPIHCPNAAECYCNVWGLCDLKCSVDRCEGRYILPPYSTLPDGWPLIGWDGQPQDPSQGGLPGY